MVAHESLLPGNATKWELLVSETDDELARLGDPYEGIRIADATPPASFLPWLVYEYGLGELTPYLPNLYALIAEGIKWQRIRGTWASILMGLGWLGYSGNLEEEPARRRRWNRFQIELDRVRDDDLPDLRQIDGIVSLSPPLRSKFSRAFNGYDVRAAETSYQRLGWSIIGDHSGTTIPGVGAQWSFGRLYQFDQMLTEEELTDLGTWIDPVDEGGLWVDADYLWADADFLWSVPGVAARRLAIAGALLDLGAYIRFTGDAGTIGYARATLQPVAIGSGGYNIVGTDWRRDTERPTAVVVQATTGWGDGAGQTARHADLYFGGTRAPGVKPGRLWLAPGEISGGVAVASNPVSIRFGLTVRERVQVLLRF